MKLRAPIPSFDGANWLNNIKVNEKLFTEKPTFVHFWSVSCDLCKYGLDTISGLADKYDTHINVIAVHMPRTEEDMILQNVKTVANYYHIAHPLVVDNDFLITDRFANRYVPAYYLFDEKGQLRHYQAGGAALRMLEKRIQRIIEDSKR
ncbi:redoxin domain-containing protein [Lysinibacillus odysseyi]|uniref:Thiol-disulfide oxidoreductase n=1 Tax=Lysinibacillus odysseyi 34hs-1 = NBRC 100172 TaxID=1220589 RepID=A0A0A3IGS3_9BACI|nr:redoxin domain-containing protein [Lysinibacillus odysseyi]KGR83924.1 thiol-disulfide oxidoreductase [Lysinibacillus odysseyi 34hs-1 = NBRC 100172]